MIEPLLEYVTQRGAARQRATLRHATTSGRSTRSSSTASSSASTAAPSRSTGSAPDRHLEAAFYRNVIIHFFVNRAIAELAAGARGEDVGAMPRGVAGGAAAARPAQVRVLLRAQARVPRGDLREDACAWLGEARRAGRARPLVAAPCSSRTAYCARSLDAPSCRATARRDRRRALDEKRFVKECARRRAPVAPAGPDHERGVGLERAVRDRR